jgi:hypothetical protein
LRRGDLPIFGQRGLFGPGRNQKKEQGAGLKFIENGEIRKRLGDLETRVIWFRWFRSLIWFVSSIRCFENFAYVVTAYSLLFTPPSPSSPPFNSPSLSNSHRPTCAISLID